MSEDFMRFPDGDVTVQASREKIKHLLVGSPAVVRRTIQVLHTKGYAEAGFWSRPVLAGAMGDSEKHVLME